MTEKELELRNKIKQHASRLKEYHYSEKKKRSEAQINLEEVKIIILDIDIVLDVRSCVKELVISQI